MVEFENVSRGHVCLNISSITSFLRAVYQILQEQVNQSVHITSLTFFLSVNTCHLDLPVSVEKHHSEGEQRYICVWSFVILSWHSTIMSYAGSYVAKSYADKPYGGSVYTGYPDEKSAKEVYDDQLKREKRKRRESICCEVVALLIGFIGLIGVAAVTGLRCGRSRHSSRRTSSWWRRVGRDCGWTATGKPTLECNAKSTILCCFSSWPPGRQGSHVLLRRFVRLRLHLVGCRDALYPSGRLPSQTKHIVLVSGGCLFLAGCLTTIIPVSWTAHVIIQDFYKPLLIDAQRRELGEALYIGWVTSALLFSAGVILLCRHAPRTQDKQDMAAVLYRAGSAPYNYSYRPGYEYQPAYGYQPGYNYQPALFSCPDSL